jgi:hypothetical protein
VGLTLQTLVMEVQQKGADVAKKGLADLNTEGGKAPGIFGAAGGGLGKFIGIAAGLAGAAGGAFVVVDALKGCVQAAMDSQVAISATNGVLASTKGISGQTAESIQRIADKYADLVGIDDDVVRSGENMLLTFTNIRGDAFEPATKAAIDMATAMNNGVAPSAEAVKNQALQLGKALNDPLKGMGALSKVGVTFTDEQKKLIATYMKHGETAKAQGVILKELGTEFGNAGKAAGDTLPGQIGRMNKAWGDVQKTVGNALIPIIANLLTNLAPVITAIGDNLPGAIATTKGIIAGAVAVISNAVGWFNQWKGVIGIVAGILGVVFLPAIISTGIQAAIAGASLLSSFVVGVVTSGATSVVSAGQMVGSFVAGLLTTNAQAITTAGTFLTTLIPGIVSTGASFVAMAVTGIASAVTGFIGYIPVALAAAAATIAATWPIIAIIAGIALLVGGIILLIQHWGDVSKFFQKLGSIVSDTVGKILSFLGGLKDKAIALIMSMVNIWLDIYIRFPIKVLTFIGEFVVNLVRKFLELKDMAVAKITEFILRAVSIFQSLPGKVLGFVASMVLQVVSTISQLPGKMAGIGGSMIDGLLGALRGGVGQILNFLGGLAGQMLDRVKGVFGIHSPSKAFAEIGANLGAGLVAGLAGHDVHGKVAAHLSRLNKTRIRPGGAPSLTGTALRHGEGGSASSGSASSGSGGGSGDGGGTTIVLQIDGQRFARVVLPPLTAELKHLGVKLA